MKRLTQGATRLLVLVLGLGLATTAWADTLRVLGNDVVIHSNATASDRSGYAITTGSLSFNTPSGCSAGDSLLFTKLQMINEGTQNNYTYAQTITITADGKTYTSGNVVTSTESLGNLGSKSVLTYNFPNVPVQAGSSYAITFNNAGSAGIRYGVENTNTYTGYTISLTGSSDNWHPYGAITATKVLSSSPDVGDKILLSNTATSGTADASATKKDFLSVSIPTGLGLPNGSVIRVSKVNLASWNNSYSAGQDPYGIYLNGVRSLNLKGESTYASSEASSSITLNNATIQVNGSTSSPRLSYAFASNCDLTLGTTYEAASNNSSIYTASGKGVTLLHANGTPIIGSGAELAAVRHVSATSGVIVNGNVSGSYPVYEMYAEVVSIPTETATISEEGTYTLAGLFTSVSSEGRYTINVNESATLNIDAAPTVKTITFNVAADKTLTLTGSSTLSASIINVNGEGMVATSSSSSLAGTLRGDGTVAYSAAPSGLTLNDAAWEGVLWLKNVEIVGLVPGNVTSANSTLRLTGCTGYFNNAGTAATNPQSTDGTLDLQDDGSTKAFTVSNGWSDDGITVFGKLTGTGTLACSTADISQRYVFKNAAQFTGTINTERTDSAGSYYLRVILGDGASLAPRVGTITVASGATASVAAGKTWNAWAINVNGTLNVGNGSTIPAINTGSTGAIIAPSGTATISGVQGNAISAGLGMVGGNIVVSGATGITELTIPADATQETQTFLAQNGNKLDLSGCTSLTTLKLVLGNSTTFDLGNVILPASCTTVKYVVAAGSLRDLSAYTAPTGLGSLTCDFPMTETREEYAKGTFSVANVPANATVTVTRYNGTSAIATVTEGTARLADYGTVQVSGVACWHDYEFNNNWTDSGSGGAHDCKTWNSNDPNFAEDADKEGNYFVYTSIRPGPTDSKAAYLYPTEWSAAIRCTVPQTANGIIVCFGKVTNSAGLNQYIALVSGDTAGKVRLVHGAGGGAAQTIAEMTVANPTTSQHVYVFTKTATTVTVYCDGDLITSKAVSDSPYHAFQFGSMYGGMQTGSGLSAVTDKAAGGMVDYTRLYDFAISDDMIQKLAQDDPYDSSTPTYSREVSGSPWWHTVDGTWLKLDDATLVGVPDVAGIVDLTATADAAMTVNLPAAPVYEKLTFQGAGAVTLVKDGNSPKIATAKLVVKTNVTAPYDIADFSGARVSVDAGKVLTFDFSTYPLESVTGVTTQQVTGVTTRADDRYAVAASTKPAWNSRLSLIYDPVEYVYSVVIDPAAIVTKNDTAVTYPTVAAALTALSTDAGTIRLLVDYDQNIALSDGQTLDVGSTTYSGSVSAASGCVLGCVSGIYTSYANTTGEEWTGAVDSSWNNAGNWDKGFVPLETTPVTFSSHDGGWTVGLVGNDYSAENVHKCASMTLNGDVTFQRGSDHWAYVLTGGDIDGTGTMRLEQVGIKTAASGSVTIGCPVVGHASANDNFFSGSGATYTFTGTVNVSAGEFKSDYAHLVFSDVVTIQNGGYVKANGSGATATFNGGISVPENAAASLTVSSGGTHTIASTVTLADGATFTIPTASTTVSGATFETSVADSYVKGTVDGSTTVYSVAAKRTATVSVGANAALSINGNAVADGGAVKFVPGDVLTITASADTYYTPALTVNGAAQTSPYQLTTTDADVTVSATATRDTVAITIPSVDNTTVSVSYTSGGAAQEATAAGDITVDAGTDVTANWTAASGYKITSGASQALNAVTSAQTLASPTVEEMSATVSDVAFDYGKDFATATVTATVSGDATAYTLTVGGTDYAGTVDGTTVTFSNVVTGHSSAYDSVSYEITATDGTSSVVVSGGSGAAPVADVTAGWINENATTHGLADAGGAWTNAVTYANGKAEISDNRFEATTASTASRVVLEFNVCFSAINTDNLDGEAQAAIKLGEVDSATTFMVLASNAAWTPVSRGDFVPDASATYKVVMTIDYGNSSYGVTVGDNVLTNASGSASFPLAKSGATSVKNIDFAGSGTLTSMKGDQVEGYMVKDNAGHWYATIQDATQAYSSANGPYTVLHDGTAPSGWQIVNGVLKKVIKGFLFMAY